MLGTQTMITSLSLYELSDNAYEHHIKTGAYWDIIKLVSKTAENEECYNQLTNTFDKLNSETRFIFAVSALNVFLQNNFTGPLLTLDILKSISREDAQICSTYSTINNAMYPLVRCLKLFQLAQIYFRSREDLLLTDLLFKLRCTFINQVLLDEVCPTLFRELDKIVETIENSGDFATQPKEIKCKIFVEFGFIYLHFSQFSKSRKYIEMAKTLIGFNFHLTGALGKRTKFQTKDLPQLRVETIIEENITDEAPLENEPEKIDLGDDTLLDKISFNNASVSTVSNLTAPILLHTASLKLKDFCLDDLLREEVIAFLEAIIEGKTFSYCIATHAYFMRSHLEKKSMKRLTRSMEQLEEVIQGFDCKRTCARTGSLFTSGLPPMWIQEKLLAELYTSVGSHKSALDIFERLQMYEEQITALQSIGRYEAAEKLTRTLLAKEETPKLYCILGDTTQDIAHYEKAWELSGQSSARAMKALGYHYFNVKDYPKALECLLLSVECNHLQGGLWFTAGCTALTIPDYTTAIKCFRESVFQDDENGQAWSNLGAAFERTAEVEKAFNCYKEATRCSHNNWKVWDNFICAAAQIKHFSGIIHAYRQIINLGQKYSNRTILNCLVTAVRDNIQSATGENGITYYDKILDLFKFASTKVTTNFDLWRSYAALHLDVKGREDVSKGIGYLIKAYHSAALHIEKSLEDFMKCVECSKVLHKYVIQESKESPTYAQHLQSLKSILHILITKGNRLVATLDEGSEAREASLEYVNEANKHLEEVEEAQLYV